jgi:anaphase-promoting complex subunit 8
LLQLDDEDEDDDEGSDTEADSTMGDNAVPRVSRLLPSLDPREARLELRERHKFLLAKSFFDCREYDRCAAVFLPATIPRIPTAPSSPATAKTRSPPGQGKGKTSSQQSDSPGKIKPINLDLSRLSQRSLFLAVYAKYLAGEKRKDEESEMILGPADGGVTLNKELSTLIGILGRWLEERESRGQTGGGWLEYLYGILLAKNKSEDQARRSFVKSVNLYPFNWGAWQELSNLINTAEEVSFVSSMLSWPYADTVSSTP